MVFEAPTATVDRRQLIEHITGTGMVTTTGRWRGPAPDAEELLRVEGLTQAGVVEDASFSLRAGDVLGIAGLVGAGRTELVRMIFGADPSTSGRVLVRGKPVRLRGPRDGMRAGIVLLPEDRRHQGTVATFSVRKNMTLPTLARFRASPVLPFPSPARERASGARPRRAPRDQGARHREPDPEPLGREPAEGRARQVARLEGGDLHLRRAHPRDRRRLRRRRSTRSSTSSPSRARASSSSPRSSPSSSGRATACSSCGRAGSSASSRATPSPRARSSSAVTRPDASTSRVSGRPTLGARANPGVKP